MRYIGVRLNETGVFLQNHTNRKIRTRKAGRLCKINSPCLLCAAQFKFPIKLWSNVQSRVADRFKTIPTGSSAFSVQNTEQHRIRVEIVEKSKLFPT